VKTGAAIPADMPDTVIPMMTFLPDLAIQWAF
jgi:hypothetical protein